MLLVEIETSKCICHPVNEEKANKYKKLMENGAIFPPIEVVEKNGQFYVRDGNHRCVASHNIDGKVWAYVFQIDNYSNLNLIGQRITQKKCRGKQNK